MMAVGKRNAINDAIYSKTSKLVQSSSYKKLENEY